MNRFGVLVVGGGIAGFEALLRLRRLGGKRLDVTLLSPSGVLVYRPLAVLAPFEPGQPRRYPVRQLVAELDVRWVRDRLSSVDRHARVVHTRNGHALSYDALLLAPGGRRIPPTDGSYAFSDDTVAGYQAIMEQAASGEIDSLLFAVPAGPGWALPLYELALLTVARLREAGRRRVDVAMAIPSHRPLPAFGQGAGDVIARLLDQAGIALHTDVSVDKAGQRNVVLRPAGIRLHPDRTITQPRISGPDIRGIPGAASHRFVPVDAYCRVIGSDGRVFAAGDATHLPVKHGGLAAQQADTAAAGIAHLAGLCDAPPPLRATIRGVLLTGDTPYYLAAHVIAGGTWRATLIPTAPWPATEKITARELGPYLAQWNARDELAPGGDTRASRVPILRS